MTTVFQIPSIVFEVYGLTVQHHVGYHNTTYSVICRNEQTPDSKVSIEDLSVVNTLPGDRLALILAVFIPEVNAMIRSGETEAITPAMIARVDRTIEEVMSMGYSPISFEDYRQVKGARV